MDKKSIIDDANDIPHIKKLSVLFLLVNINKHPIMVESPATREHINPVKFIELPS